MKINTFDFNINEDHVVELELHEVDIPIIPVDIGI